MVIFLHMSVEKKKNGYIRGVGLGPTPSDLELPGTRKYTSTKLQMETKAKRVADQRVDQMQEQMDDMKRRMAKMRQMLLEQQMNNSISRHVSNTPERNTRDLEYANEGVHGTTFLEDEAESHVVMHNINMHGNDDLPTRRLMAIAQKQQNKEGVEEMSYYIAYLDPSMSLWRKEQFKLHIQRLQWGVNLLANNMLQLSSIQCTKGIPNYLVHILVFLPWEMLEGNPLRGQLL